MNRTLADMLKDYIAEDSARFHMPGHKGRAMSGPLASCQEWDVTEIDCTDNLHDPHDGIAELERRIATAMGVATSVLLVNGSTAGIHAMCAYIAGGRLLLPKNAHRSAIAGAALFDVDCLPLASSDIVTAADVAAALDAVPADAVLVTSPDYYGMCADIPAIAAAAHERGALLFVDAAHGSHFPFSSKLPPSPAGYADAWVTSFHKTLNALTQTAALNIGSLDGARFRRALAMLETSSPSYLLMLSAEYALASADGVWDAHADRIAALRGRIAALDGISLVCPPCGASDITRLAIDVTGRGLTGFEAARLMRPLGIVPEMADEGRVVLITTPADPMEWYDRLLSALDGLPAGGHAPRVAPHIPSGRRVMSVREAVFAEGEDVPLSEAEGRTAAAAAGVYPPGTALLFPGESVEKAAVDELLYQSSLGGELFGVDDGMVRCVKL